MIYDNASLTLPSQMALSAVETHFLQEWPSSTGDLTNFLNSLFPNFYCVGRLGVDEIRSRSQFSEIVHPSLTPRHVSGTLALANDMCSNGNILKHIFS